MWFQTRTASDEGIISSGSKLELLLISRTFISNDSSVEPPLIFGPATVQDEPLRIGNIL
jgi:hypothetical protein